MARVRESPIEDGKQMIHSRQVSAPQPLSGRGWIHVGPSRPWPGWALFSCLVNFVIVVHYNNFEYHRSERAIQASTGNYHATGWPWNVHHYSV